MNQRQEIQKILKSNNHYDVLGISKNADKNVIREAYKSNVRKFHPDKNNYPQAKTAFNKISNAYQQLYNEGSKHKYDDELKQKMNMGAGPQKSSQNQSQNQPKREENRGNRERYGNRKEEKPKSEQESFKAQRQNFRPQKENKPKKQEPKEDFSKYFKPPYNNSYQNEKKERNPFPEPKSNSSQSNFQEEKWRRRTNIKLKQNKVDNWSRVFLTFVIFFIFWSFVPNYTKSEPIFMLQKSQKYSFKKETLRYKFAYYMKPQNAEREHRLDEKIEKQYIKKLEADCQNAINTKDKYTNLITKDPQNAIFWQKQMKRVSYKPCTRILKLVKKYPNIELVRFVHLIR